jgi:predicted dehydrogenase
MSEAGQIKLAHFGYGAWGPNLVRNLSAIPGAVLVAVAEPDRQRLTEVPRVAGLGTTPDYRDVLSRADVDAVVIATPASTHARLAREALLAGKHVLVEKPMTTSLREAEMLVETAETTGKLLMVGHTFLYEHAVEWLKRAVDGGELGTLRYAAAHRLNLGRVQSDVDVLWNVGPHDVSILLHLLGPPLEVSARAFAYLRKGFADVAFLTLIFPGDVAAHLHLSAIDPCKVRLLTLVGSRASVTYDDVSANARIVVHERGIAMEPERAEASVRRGESLGVHVPFAEPLRIECQHFVDCIRRGRRPRTGGAEGLAVVRVLDAAERSIADGRPVHLDPGRG